MKVSIITVAYNAAATIESTIQSVLEQDYGQIEYIVIEGASTDGTRAIIETYRSQIDHFISEPDKGLYYALNKGIQLASGDIVGILHADDLFAYPGVVSDVVEQLRRSGSDSLYGDLLYVDPQDVNKVLRYWKSGHYKAGRFKQGWMPPHPTFFVKKEMYERHGLFNTDLRSAADYELMLRMLHKEQVKVSYLPQVLVKMRSGGLSNRNIGNRVKANLEDRKAWKMNGIQPRFYTLWSKPLRKLPQYLLAWWYRRRAK